MKSMMPYGITGLERVNYVVCYSRMEIAEENTKQRGPGSDENRLPMLRIVKKGFVAGVTLR